MTEHKNSYDKLTPADQVAIESMIKAAKPDELTDAYRQKIAKETLKKRPMGFGDVIIIILLVAAAFLFFILPMIEIAYYTDAFREAGPAICQAHGSTYVNIDLHSWVNVKIICSDFTIKLP